MTSTSELFVQDREKAVFDLLLLETRQLSERLLERMEDLFELYPSVELRRAIARLHDVQLLIPE
jgi:hypothetical protein